MAAELEPLELDHLWISLAKERRSSTNACRSTDVPLGGLIDEALMAPGSKVTPVDPSQRHTPAPEAPLSRLSSLSQQPYRIL